MIRPSLNRLTMPGPDALVNSFGIKAPPRFSTVTQAFNYQATNYPNVTAVEHLGESITYAELDKRSSEFANKLCSLGVRPGKRVILLVRRSLSMIIAILAILKAGCSYVPLDGGVVNDSTISSVLCDTCPAVVLCSIEYLQRMTSHAIPTFSLEAILKEITNYAAYLPQPNQVSMDEIKPSDEIYLIFTSGTTGRPKGVCVTHRNVTNRKYLL